MFTKVLSLTVIILMSLSIQAAGNNYSPQKNNGLNKSVKNVKSSTSVKPTKTGTTVYCKPNNPIHEVTKKGDITAVKQLIMNKVNINCTENYKLTPLITASKKGHYEIVRLLLLANAKINHAETGGRVALTYALSRRHIKTILLLLSAKANTKLAIKDRYFYYNKLLATIINTHDISSVNIRSPRFTISQIENTQQLKLLKNVNMKDLFSNTLLHVAAKSDNAKASKILLQAKVNVNSVNTFGDTALILAVKNGNTEIVKQLITASANVNKVNGRGFSPLQIAVTHGYTAIVKLLLLNKADVNVVNTLGNSALHIASSKGYTNLVKQLISAKAKLNVFNKRGDTPLCIAAGRNDIQGIKLLLAANAKVNKNTKYPGCSPLYNASRKGHTGVVKLLLAANADIANGPNSSVIQAIRSGHVNIFSLLLNSKRLREKLSDQYMPLLYEAASNGRTEMVALILAAKPHKIAPKVTVIDDTPLQVAANNGMVGVVKLLLASKKYPSNAKSATKALLYAMSFENSNASVIMPLIAAKANINATDAKGNTPLHMTIPYTSEYTQNRIKIVLQANPDVNKPNKKGFTPLMLAVEDTGNTTAVYILLGAKAKVNQVVKINGKNMTALGLARKKGYTRTIKLLKAHGAK